MQYPDSIIVRWKTDPVKGAGGQWTPGEDVSHTFKCRKEANTKARTIPGADGSMIYYSYLVYMPLTTVGIPYGADYELNGSHKGKVKGANNGQLNSRIWL
jgi:hypothetical protein